MANRRSDIRGEKFKKIASETEGRRWVDVPSERLKETIFHGHNVFGHEIAATEVNER